MSAERRERTPIGISPEAAEDIFYSVIEDDLVTHPIYGAVNLALEKLGLKWRFRTMYFEDGTVAAHFGTKEKAREKFAKIWEAGFGPETGNLGKP